MTLKHSLILSPIILSIFLITGCSLSTSNVDTSTVNELDNAPSWVKVQNVDGQLSVLGEKINDELSFIQLRDEAILDAQTNLTNTLNEKVTFIFTMINDTNVDQERYAKNVDLATKEVVDESIKNSKVLKLWQDDAKTTYILTTTDIQKLKDSIRLSLHTHFKSMPSINSNYSLKLEEGKIDGELLK